MIEDAAAMTDILHLRRMQSADSKARLRALQHAMCGLCALICVRRSSTKFGKVATGLVRL